MYLEIHFVLYIIIEIIDQYRTPYKDCAKHESYYLKITDRKISHYTEMSIKARKAFEDL